MIPIGTLCIVIRTVYPRLMGKLCTTAPKPSATAFPYYVEFQNGEGYYAKHGEITPISPPGDPDAVPHDVSEPELVEVFR